MKAQDYLGKKVLIFRTKWVNDKKIVTDKILLEEGKVLEVEKNSRTIVVVVDTRQGPGWCPTKKSYVGVKKGNGWMRGENYQRGAEGTEYKCHINQLKLLED